ncbi:MAG: hypothetical protein RR413_05010, partial [Christensenellaceae bacterium]
LPTYFHYDKRKSHYASLILSNQMSRADALAKLAKPAYLSKALFESDVQFLADYLEMSKAEFQQVLDQPKHQHNEYPISVLQKIAPMARKFRKWIG